MQARGYLWRSIGCMTTIHKREARKKNYSKCFGSRKIGFNSTKNQTALLEAFEAVRG